METPAEGEGAVASEPEVKEDRWDAAEEAFNAAEEVKEVKEVPQEEVKEEGSHVEAPPDYLNLDDLRVPQKYKDVIRERVKQIASDLESKSKSEQEEIAKELGVQKEAVGALVNMFREVAQAPKEQISARVADLVEQFGQSIGLDSQIAQQLREQPQPVQQEQNYTIQDVNRYFLDKMVSTEDPKEFRALWEQADQIKSQIMEQQLLSKVGMLFKAYHDKYIAPDKLTLEEYRTKAQRDAEAAEFSTKKTSWTSASDSLKSKYKDFERYEGKMREMIRSDEDLQAGRDRLNQTPNNVDGRVKYLERLYLAVSRNDALQNLQRPTQGGLPPSQRHISTKKSGGGDWDAAYENTKELWE